MSGSVSIKLPDVVAQPVNSAILKALWDLLVTHLFLLNSHNITYVLVVQFNIVNEMHHFSADPKLHVAFLDVFTIVKIYSK